MFDFCFIIISLIFICLFTYNLYELTPPAQPLALDVI